MSHLSQYLFQPEAAAGNDYYTNIDLFYTDVTSSPAARAARWAQASTNLT